MADEFVLKFLINLVGDPNGRRRWVDHKLRAGNVDLSSVDLTDRDFRDFDFSEVNLSASILLGADLSGVDFSDAKLGLCDLRRTKLRNACFDGADLSGANLQEAALTDACMEEANLSDARLMGADLIGADLAGADLTHADLRGACLKYANLKGAKLDGANVADADLTGSILDDDAPNLLANFDLAKIDDRKYRMLKSHLIRSESAAERRLGAGLVDMGGALGSGRSASPLGFAGAGFPGAGLAGVGPQIIDYVATEGDLETEEGWYRILGIGYGTPVAGITTAFRVKAKKYHPDMLMHLAEDERDGASLQFRLAREAYEKLMRRRAKSFGDIHWPTDVPKRESAFDYSLSEYLKLSEANPKNSNVIYNLAWKFFDEGYLDESIEAYEKVLALDPEDEDAGYNLRIVKLCKTFDVPPATALGGPA